jgi:hypothetical protein
MDPLPGEPRTWLETHADERALLRDADFCVFLDPNQKCGIYEQRPNHCQTYPYLKTTYHATEIDVDLSCPGLGYGDRTSESFLLASNRDQAPAKTFNAGILEVESLLHAHQRYASPEVLTSLAKRTISKLVRTWSSEPPASLRVRQSAPLLINAITEAQAAEMWQGLLWMSQSREALHADAEWVERHFGNPRWSTRLEEKDVTTYRFWITEGIFYLEERGEPLQTANLRELDSFPWQEEALKARQAYLDRWQKRQLLIRLSANLAVARLLRGDHIVTCYLQFLTEIDHRLAVLAPALARLRRKRAIDRSIALEAIRGSDGLLRAWCESARLGISD